MKEFSFEAFASGNDVRIRATAAASDREEIVWRVRAQIGELCYRLLTNNCEPFCDWCEFGRHRSGQVAPLLCGPARWRRRTRAAARARAGVAHFVVRRALASVDLTAGRVGVIALQCVLAGLRWVAPVAANVST